MKPIASTYVHFLDRYHGRRAALGNHYGAAIIRREANLAFRIALMFSQQVILPCSSIYESELCRLTIDDFPEFRTYGVIGLSSPDSSIQEHLFRKRLTYDAGSPADLSESYERLRAQEIPSFHRKVGSTTRQLTRAWSQAAELMDLEDLLRDGAPISALGQLESLWPNIPELLEGRAFVPDHVNEIFAQRQIPVRPSAAAEIIEPAYIAEYAQQFGSVVSDLAALNSPFKYGVADHPKLSYRDLAQRLHRFGLIDGLEFASSGALWHVYCQAEWDTLAGTLFSGTASHVAEELAQLIVARLAGAATSGGISGRRGALLTGSFWYTPPDAANDPVDAAAGHVSMDGKRGGMVSNSTGELFAAVLCAVECEYQALIRAIPPNGALSGDQYVTTMPSGRRVLVRRQRSMGNYAAAVTTTQIILEERPENLILAGIAGGFPSDDRRLGDLLVADQVIAYESAKLRGEAVELRPQAFRTSFDLVAASEAVFRGEEWRKRIAVVPPEQQADGPKLHVGTTLSGDKVVAKSGFMEEFRALWTKTTGIEMEAAGAMTAVHLSKLQPRFLMIKAICDHADEDKADGWQPYAADVAAAFVAEMLDSKAMGQLPERVAATPSAALTGEERHEIQERMYRDWDQIATYFGVSHRERSGFRRGQESQEIWDWLMSRRRLHELPAALLCVSRQDIVNRFPRLADKLMAEQEAQKA